MSMFQYPSFDASGVKILSRAGEKDNDMMMDVDVYQMKKGDTRTFQDKSPATSRTHGKGKRRRRIAKASSGNRRGACMSVRASK